jgi:hypothetical protein
MVALIFLLMDLNLMQSTEYRQQGRLYLVLDESDSITRIPERVDRLNQFQLEIQKWAEENFQTIEVFAFSENLRASKFGDQFRGGNRTLIQSLDQLPPVDEGAVLLVSDGNFSGAIQYRGKVFSVQIGSPDERDLWFEKTKPIFTAFLKNRIMIPVSIGQQGYAGKTVKVLLTRLGEKIFEQQIKLQPGGAQLEIPYFPEKMGEDLLQLEIEPFEDELSDLNNKVSFRVRTVRDKIRVLHISGRPDVDLKAWRIFLTRQPDVDLVSFYILRSLQDEPGARNSELSLIPFPYEELFSTELEKFDIVLLQNFNFNLYFQSFYLRNLASFITEGGSLLVFGGDQSLQNYKDSPLDPLFPFKYVGEGDFVESSLRARVLSRHPLVRGIEGSFETRTWSRRHRLASEPGASDLVRFADGTPFLSVREVGKGRVAVLNTDESWRLHFEPSMDSAAFGKMARRLLQYLTFDPEMEARKIQSGPWRIGKKVDLSLSDKDMGIWKIRDWSSQKNLYQSKVAEANVSFEVPRAGVYLVETSSLNEIHSFETEEKPWLVEWKNLVSQDEPLQKLSEKTQGAFFSFDERQKIFDQNISSRQLVSAKMTPWSRENIALSWIFLLTTLLFLFVDFYLRKKTQWDA